LNNKHCTAIGSWNTVREIQAKENVNWKWKHMTVQEKKR